MGKVGGNLILEISIAKLLTYLLTRKRIWMKSVISTEHFNLKKSPLQDPFIMSDFKSVENTKYVKLKQIKKESNGRPTEFTTFHGSKIVSIKSKRNTLTPENRESELIKEKPKDHDLPFSMDSKRCPENFSLRKVGKIFIAGLTGISKLVGIKRSFGNSNDKSLILVVDKFQEHPKLTTDHLPFKPSFNQNFEKFSTSCTSSDGKSSDNNKLGRHLYHEEVAKAVNNQILNELNACYAYLSMACYFARSDVALPGCQGFFMRMHEEEHGHALKFINFQTLRGADVKLYPIHAPECQDWECIERAFSVSLDMEKLIKEKLLEVHSIATKHNDISTTDLIESQFIGEQERSICEFARLLKRLTSMGSSGIAEYLFDKELHKVFVKNVRKKGIDVSPEEPTNYL